MSGATTALVGATDRTKTRHFCVMFPVALASEGHARCVLDAACAAQGLTEYVTGRLDPGVTA